MTFPCIVCQPAVLVLPSLSSDLLPFLHQSHPHHSNYEASTHAIALIGMNKHCQVVRSLNIICLWFIREQVSKMISFFFGSHTWELMQAHLQSGCIPVDRKSV